MNTSFVWLVEMCFKVSFSSLSLSLSLNLNYYGLWLQGIFIDFYGGLDILRTWYVISRRKSKNASLSRFGEDRHCEKLNFAAVSRKGGKPSSKNLELKSSILWPFLHVLWNTFVHVYNNSAFILELKLLFNDQEPIPWLLHKFTG
jgi:hypothetical protein